MEETKKLGFESAADGVGLFDKENPKNLPTEEELTVAMETAHRESRKVKNKPERVFGLQVRCRELDIFKIRNF